MNNFYRYKSLLLIFLCLICFKSFGINKNFPLHHITTEDGLSHNEVRVITQDKDGVLWFGTQNGLCSYDGYDFDVFKYDEKNNRTIKSDKVYSISPSNNNGLWIGTTASLNFLNTVSNEANRWVDTLNIYTGLNQHLIATIFEDENSEVWINSSGCNYRYAPNKQHVELIFKGEKVQSYYAEKDSTFWIALDWRLIQYDRDKREVVKEYPLSIDAMATDRFGILWALGRGGLYQFIPSEDRFQKVVSNLQLKNKGERRICADREGNIWTASYGGGVNIYLPKTRDVVHLRSNPLLKESLSSNDVYSLFCDRSGVVWIGTQEGLDFYDWSRHRFVSWQHIPSDSTSLSCNFVQAIARDYKDRLLVGTRDRGVEQAVIVNGRTIFKKNIFKGENAKILSRSYVSSIFSDSKNRIWITTLGGGLFMQPPKGELGRFVYNSSDSMSIPSNSSTSIIEDQRGRIWIATTGGLSLLEDGVDEYRFKNFRHDPYDPQTISLNGIYKVFEDSKGRIWLGINYGGVNLLHEDKDEKIWFERFMHLASDSLSISSNEAFAIFEDESQQIWIGTSASGLNKVVEDENGRISFISYTEDDGLADNEVNSILQDEFGYLWLGTNKGLSKFDEKSKRFVNYSTYDGVVKGKFRKNAAWRDNDGTMYFGGAAGVNSFRPSTFVTNRIAPELRFTSLLIDDVEYRKGDFLDDRIVLAKKLQSGATINLQWPKNRFSVKFSALSYASSQRNEYKWRLLPVDTLWNEMTQKEPFLFFADLPSGNFELQIIASNNDNVWMDSPISLKVNVSRDSLLGYIIVIIILVVATVVGIVVGFRRRSVQKEKAKGVDVPEEFRDYIDRLQQLMVQEKRYLNPNLGLNDLADELNITSNQLSAILNDGIGKNFYEYVNQYRIEAIKELLKDPEQNSKTILAMAWDCGFNSKSAFNRVFKLSTGMTPSEYQRRYKTV